MTRLELETILLQLLEAWQRRDAATLAARHLGEFCGLAATGRLFHVHGASYYAFQNSAIARTRSIYDITGLLMQIGVLRAKPGF